MAAVTTMQGTLARAPRLEPANPSRFYDTFGLRVLRQNTIIVAGAFVYGVVETWNKFLRTDPAKDDTSKHKPVNSF